MIMRAAQTQKRGFETGKSTSIRMEMASGDGFRLINMNGVQFPKRTHHQIQMLGNASSTEHNNGQNHPKKDDETDDATE